MSDKNPVATNDNNAANNTDLHEVVARLSERVDTLEKEKANLEKALTNSEKPAKEEPPKIPEETFKVGNKEYKFKAAVFTLPPKYTGGSGRKSITAVDALADKKIQKILVEINSGIITEVK